MNSFIKLFILGNFLINYSGILFANNTLIFKHIECEVRGGKDKSKLLILDIADTFKKRSYGLMNREKIEENTGMLFIWNNSEIRDFWMKNTYFDLDLFFLNNKGVIVEIYKNAKAFDKTNISSKKKVMYVIELKSGEHDFIVGDKLICIEGLF